MLTKAQKAKIRNFEKFKVTGAFSSINSMLRNDKLFTIGEIGKLKSASSKLQSVLANWEANSEEAKKNG